MKKTGEILKKAREEKGLSLHEIGLSLKINSKILKAIEDGEDPNLPAKTFLRGFVLSYANYLHLNSDEVLKVFYEEVGSTKPKPYIRPVENEVPVAAEDGSATVSATEEAAVTPIRTKPAKNKNKNKNDDLKSLHEKKNTKSIAIGVLVFALIGLIVFTKKMIDKYSKEAEVPTAEVEQTIKGVTPVVPEVTPIQAADGTANPSEALSNLTGGLENTAAAPATPATTTPAASDVVKPAAETVATPSAPTAITNPPAVANTATTDTAKPVVAAVNTETAAKPVTKTEETNKPVELIVEALDTVEIEYSAPNGKPQKIKLSAEQVHTFKSKSGLKISFSNGGAVNLIHNGKEIGIPGDLGKPVKLSY